jgi:iron-sulfur cluster repair protein YtfE (RIC family)
MDAIALLKQDHGAVKRLFERYQAEAPSLEVVELVFVDLAEHTRIEEEIFYPAVAALGDELARLVDESRRDHETVDRLIAELKRELGAHADLARGGAFDAKFQKLRQEVERHVAKEEGRMFPAAASRLAPESARLAQEMEACKHALDATGVPAT